MSNPELLEKIKAELEDWDGIEDPAPYASRRDLAILRVRRLNRLYQKYLEDYLFWDKKLTENEQGIDAVRWRWGFVRTVHPFLCSSAELLIADAAIEQALPKDITIDPQRPIASLLEADQLHRSCRSAHPLPPLSDADKESLQRAEPILRRAMRPETSLDLEISAEEISVLRESLEITGRLLRSLR